MLLPILLTLKDYELKTELLENFVDKGLILNFPHNSGSQGQSGAYGSSKYPIFELMTRISQKKTENAV